MSHKESLLTPDELRHVLEYCPSTGLFKWKVKIASVTFPGKPAGNLHPTGYMRIKYKGVYYFAHRLAWLYMYGSWPSMQIDHINCNKADNRFSNLRDVSANVNQQNKNCQSRSSSGLKGVTWHKAANKWQAQIKTGEKTIYIGIFDTKEAAFDKYKEAASVYHTHNRVVLQS